MRKQTAKKEFSEFINNFFPKRQYNKKIQLRKEMKEGQRGKEWPMKSSVDQGERQGIFVQCLTVQE